jgi:hypothetical protein
MKDQLDAEIVTKSGLAKADSWLRLRGYALIDGAFQKDANKVILDAEGIFVKKGKYTEDCLSLNEMIQLLNK